MIDNTYVGTWVIITGTITATEYIIDVVGTVDGYISTRNRSSITSTINVVDTCSVATVDNDSRIGFCLLCIGTSGYGGIIGSLITTSIDSFHIIAAFLLGFGILVRIAFLYSNVFCRFILRLINMYRYSTLGSTVGIIGTKDAATNYTAFLIVGDIFVQLYCDITTYEGFNSFFVTRLAGCTFFFLSQASTIDIARDGSLIQIDCCCFIRTGCQYILAIFVSIGVSKSRTAIDIAIYGSRSREYRCSICRF